MLLLIPCIHNVNSAYCCYIVINSPIMLRKFDSGVMVIQNKAHSDEEVRTFSFV